MRVLLCTPHLTKLSTNYFRAHNINQRPLHTGDRERTQVRRPVHVQRVGLHVQRGAARRQRRLRHRRPVRAHLHEAVGQVRGLALPVSLLRLLLLAFLSWGNTHGLSPSYGGGRVATFRVIFYTDLVETRESFRVSKHFCHTYYWNQI